MIIQGKENALNLSIFFRRNQRSVNRAVFQKVLHNGPCTEYLFPDFVFAHLAVLTIKAGVPPPGIYVFCVVNRDVVS